MGNGRGKDHQSPCAMKALVDSQRIERRRENVPEKGSCKYIEKVEMDRIEGAS